MMRGVKKRQEFSECFSHAGRSKTESRIRRQRQRLRPRPSFRTPYSPLALLILAVIVMLQVSAGFRYSAPEFCRWVQVSPDSNQVRVTCSVTSAVQEGNSSWASGVQADGTVWLKVQCAEGVYLQNTVSNYTMDHLHALRELELDACKLAALPERAFQALPQLRNLSVRTYNDDWSALALHLHARAFVGLRQLERLDLSYNGIWTVAPLTFCPLVGLQTLNLTHNRIRDLRSLSFGPSMSTGGPSETDGDPDPPTEPDNIDPTVTAATTTWPTVSTTDEPDCTLDIVAVDMSHNSVRTLPSEVFASLPRLRELRLGFNRVATVSERALAGLHELRVLDVSSNRLNSLPPGLLSNCSELTELRAANNSLSVLAPGLFTGLRQMLTLDLSRNRLTDAWVNGDTFTDLIRLVVLDLGHNRLARLDAALFGHLYSLQILHLGHNEIESVAEQAFVSLYNLHTLVLSHNRLRRLDANALAGLYGLSLLSIDHNRLEAVHADAFRNCTHLEALHLNGNRLSFVPEAMTHLAFLHTLDLGENRVEKLPTGIFKGLRQLTGLRLMGNAVDNVSKDAFADLPSLKSLNLARNSLEAVEPGTFEAAPALQALRLDANHLVDITGLFSHLPALRWLNISANRLAWFDYALVPLGLHWLDLRANRITALGNYFELEGRLQLQTLDASANRITELGAAAVPDAVQHLLLSDNLISSVQPYTFFKKQNLTRVDLFGNKLRSLELNALRLTPVAEDRALPEFHLGGNPLECDCRMEWLQRANALALLRQHPRVVDLESIYCRLLHSGSAASGKAARRFVPLVDVLPSQFLCPYAAHCFALCRCCDFDACDCKMTCPAGCTCYHDQSWTANIVACTTSNLTKIPDRLPMDATDIYMDGNYLQDVPSHAFIGRKNVRGLFLNASRVFTLSNRTFNGLRALTSLHLHDNFLTELRGFEFERLDRLRELDLRNNRLSTVANITFIPLRSLQVLRLDGNHLVDFAVWTAMPAHNPLLVTVTLSRNPWSCRCVFAARFMSWLRDPKGGSVIVSDAEAIRCAPAVLSSSSSSSSTPSTSSYTSQPTRFPTATSSSPSAVDGVRSKSAIVGAKPEENDTMSSRDDDSNSGTEAWIWPDFEKDYWESGAGAVSAVDAARDASLGPRLLDLNVSVSAAMCENGTSSRTVVQPHLVEDYMPVLVVTLAVFALLMIILLVLFVYRHELRVRLYARYGVRLCHKSEDGGAAASGGASAAGSSGGCAAEDDGKLFDAFVSYSSKDEGFVMQVLAPELECGTPGYKLCLHYRDFPVGSYVSDTIVEAVESSRRTILVLSENFLKSEWCRFEFKSAHHEVLKDRRKRLVVVLLGEVARRDLDPDIRLYLKTNTYLRWGDRLFWEKLRFAMPDVRARSKSLPPLPMPSAPTAPPTTLGPHYHHARQQQQQQQLQQQLQQHHNHHTNHHPATNTTAARSVAIHI